MTTDEEKYVTLIARAVRAGSIAKALPLYREAEAIARRIRRRRAACGSASPTNGQSPS